jgi:hypothetical protein
MCKTLILETALPAHAAYSSLLVSVILPLWNAADAEEN